MKDSFPFKVYTSTGLIVSECSTMSKAIEVAKKLNCNWTEAGGQQVGQLIKLQPSSNLPTVQISNDAD